MLSSLKVTSTLLWDNGSAVRTGDSELWRRLCVIVLFVASPQSDEENRQVAKGLRVTVGLRKNLICGLVHANVAHGQWCSVVNYALCRGRCTNDVYRSFTVSPGY